MDHKSSEFYALVNITKHNSTLTINSKPVVFKTTLPAYHFFCHLPALLYLIEVDPILSIVRHTCYFIINYEVTN